MDRTLSILGIAKKANLIAIGLSDVSAATQSGNAVLILSASDASDGSVRRAQTDAGNGGAIHITVPYSKLELGHITGRGSPGTIAFLDAGLAAGFVKGLVQAGHDRYSEAAEQLTRSPVAGDKCGKHTTKQLRKQQRQQ